MADRYDTIVFGVGAMGAAACLELARRGDRVLGLERFALPHEFGSSHGQSRIFRIAYFEHPDYVPLLLRARERWLAIGRDAGEDLLLQTGGLWLGRPEDELIAGTRRAAEQHDLHHEVLSTEEVARRHPEFRVPAGHVGFFEADAGTLRPEAAVFAMARLAREAGATIHTRERISDWNADAKRVVLRTDRGVYEAERLVITAGAWSMSALADLGASLAVTRHPTAWFRVRDRSPFDPATFPCWALVRDSSSFFYGFPLIDGDERMKIALHGPGESTDPDNVNRALRDDEAAMFRAALEALLPAAAGPLAGASVCLYTSSADGHPVVDRHPIHENVVFACGFSGHGFKLAPVVGEALADLSRGGRSDLPVGFLGLARFQDFGG